MGVIWFNDKDAEKSKFSGNKGANLAKLVRFGHKVPLGFCISERTSESEIKQALKNLPIPWAVRSSSSAEDSAGLAFPGIFETYLGLTKSEEVISAIKKVINSKNSETVKRYAEQNKIDSDGITMAVVIQTLINPECSGVAFSQNPVSAAKTIVIEANWGLGETLVDGIVSPDYYEVTHEGQVIQTRKGTKKIKAVFSDGKVQRSETSPAERERLSLPTNLAKKLALIVKNIAKDFGSPQDVEWAIAKDQIYILQARPITTLASIPKARIKILQKNRAESYEWKHFLTRRYNLFGASLWQHSYDSEEAERLFGMKMVTGLFLEDQAGIVRQYRELKDLAQFQACFDKLVTKKSKLVIEQLKEAESLNDQAYQMIKLKKSFDDLTAAVNFLDLLFTKATMLPNLSLAAMHRCDIKNKSLMSLAEKMREISLYQDFIKYIVMPSAAAELKNLGIKNADETVSHLTLSEVYLASQQTINKRLMEKNKSSKFCLIYQKGEESVNWQKNNSVLINKIESIDSNLAESNTLNGKIAYAGIAKGRAKLILTSADLAKKITKEDILVMISSNPRYMAAITASGGIVTDEGGMTSHAAIMAREFKKPCVIDTRFATHLIKDDDMIEVDANHGIVKIL